MADCCSVLMCCYQSALPAAQQAEASAAAPPLVVAEEAAMAAEGRREALFTRSESLITLTLHHRFALASLAECPLTSLSTAHCVGCLTMNGAPTSSHNDFSCRLILHQHCEVLPVCRFQCLICLQWVESVCWQRETNGPRRTERSDNRERALRNISQDQLTIHISQRNPTPIHVVILLHICTSKRSGGPICSGCEAEICPLC